MAPHRLQLGSFFVCLPLCVLAVAAFGVFRLGHQFPGAAASPGLLAPFLLPVLGLSLEAGGLVALSFAQLALLLRFPLASSASRARASWPLLGFLAVVLAVAEAIPRGTERPGAFANELLASARESCSQGARVPVPLLGLTVRCDAPQRIEGPMPGVPSVHVAMHSLSFSDDLRSVEIAALEVRAVRALTVTLRAGTARVAGLAPWSRSPRFSALGRFGILAALGGALWLTAALALREPLRPALPVEVPSPLPRPSSPGLRIGLRARALRWLACSLLALPGAVTAAVFISLDQDRAAPVTYLLAAVLGCVVLGMVAGVVARRLPQIFNSFRVF